MTDIFPVIANWPSMRIGQWTALLMARAIENQAYVVGVNRIGKSPKLDYCGGSTVLGPDGRVLLDCGNKEGIFSIDILKETVASTRRGFQFLKDNKEA
jgi:predicted amidohydrolase